MNSIKILVLLISFHNLSYAQIDTTTWYPLHIGDKWEYFGKEVGYSQVEIIGDTLMPNGKKYFVFPELDIRKYQRLENKRYVMVYNDSYRDEYIRFDLLGMKGNNWTIFDKEIRFGIFNTGSDYNNLFKLKLDWKEYREVYIDSTNTPIDTLWDQTVDAYWPRITKGLGVTSYANDLQELVGAVINRIGYGSLVGIKEEKINKDFYLSQNYPNPFNPITHIEFAIPNREYIELNVFNSLGQKVKTIIKEIISGRQHNVEFDGSNFSSGIYFYQIKTNNYSNVRKMLLLK